MPTVRREKAESTERRSQNDRKKMQKEQLAHKGNTAVETKGRTQDSYYMRYSIYT